jgi:hypothetical protein
MGDDDAGGSADDPDAAVELAAIEGKQLDRVVASGAVNRHRVESAIAGRPAERAGEVDQHAAGQQIGAGQIVDHDIVGTAEGMDVDPLDPVEVDGNVIDAAE